jgi:hypothetical protein
MTIKGRLTTIALAAAAFAAASLFAGGSASAISVQRGTNTTTVSNSGNGVRNFKYGRCTGSRPCPQSSGGSYHGVLTHFFR